MIGKTKPCGDSRELPDLVRQRDDDAAGVFCGGLATGEAERAQAGESFSLIIPQENEFSAPDGAIFPVTRAIPRDTEHVVGQMPVFEQTGEHMGQMMLHRDARQPEFFSKTG